MAPVASIKVICRIEVNTIRETGKEAIIPARLARIPTSSEVLKKNRAMSTVSDKAENSVEKKITLVTYSGSAPSVNPSCHQVAWVSQRSRSSATGPP